MKRIRTPFPGLTKKISRQTHAMPDATRAMAIGVCVTFVIIEFILAKGSSMLSVSFLSIPIGGGLGWMVHDMNQFHDVMPTRTVIHDSQDVNLQRLSVSIGPFTPLDDDHRPGF